MSLSIWDKILLRLDPLFWIFGVTRPTAFAAMDVACGAWGRAANVQSDGCEKNLKFGSQMEGSDYWLEFGSADINAMPKITDGGIPIVMKGYLGVEADREVYFTKRTGVGATGDLAGGGSSSDETLIARLRDRGYPVQVAAPRLQVGTVWPGNSPVIKEVRILNPPVGAPPRFVAGETLNIKVVFTEEVSFLPWDPTAVGVGAGWDPRMEEAASYQSLENLRLHLAGLKGPGCDYGFDYEDTLCRSARFDMGSNGTGSAPHRVWMFTYKIPRDVYTDPGTGFGIARDNGMQSLGASTVATSYTTPFWFAHDGWRRSNPSDRDGLTPHFQVGASFAGPGRGVDTATYAYDKDFSLLDDNDLNEYDIPDLTLESSYAFNPYNTISSADIDDILSFRKYSRDLLSFTGLTKGTPAAATYERGYVVLGWTVMMNLVFALFVIFIAWAAISSIVKPMVSGQDSGSGWKDMAPRIILAAIAVGSSFWWCRLLIDLADGVSRYVAEALAVSPGDILHIGLAVSHVMGGGSPTGFAADAASAGSDVLLLLGILLVLLFFLVLGLLIMGQFILRIVLINLLMIIAPVALSMFILPDTSGWGRKWVQLWMITLFRHALQVVCLGLALSFVRSTIPIGDEVIGEMQVFWALLLGCFALYLTWKLPSMMGDGGLSEGYLSTMTMVTNMAAHLPQAARTGANLMAAYGTGGLGAVALTGVGASSSAVSHFAGGIKSPVASSSGGGLRSHGTP